MNLEAMYKKCGSAITAVYGASNNNDIEDAVQVAMTEIWQSMKEHSDNTDAWYVQRGVYRARDYLRSKVWRHENRQEAMDLNEYTEIESEIEDLFRGSYGNAEDAAIDSITAEEVLSLLDGDV